MRLLIAEDDNDIRRALVALLQKNNYTVDETDNGTDAYAFASRGQYDGIILDIMMPGISDHGNAHAYPDSHRHIRYSDGTDMGLGQ